MRLPSLWPKYIQKSRIYFYPLLRIRRGVSVTPINTYMTWENKFSLQDHKFIVVYHLREDKEFKEFEDQKLLNNPLFDTFYELEDDTGAYVFDFSDHRHDYKKIMHGKYSMLSDDYKRTILNFFKNHKKHHAYIESYLYPDKYFDNYAELLITDRVDKYQMKKLLESVGELCSLPDFSEEKLMVKEKVITFELDN